jgi:hypothetical protein
VDGKGQRRAVPGLSARLAGSAYVAFDRHGANLLRGPARDADRAVSRGRSRSVICVTPFHGELWLNGRNEEPPRELQTAGDMESDDVATFSKLRPLRRRPHRPPKRAPLDNRFRDDCDGLDAGFWPGLRVGSCAVPQFDRWLCGSNLDNGEIEPEKLFQPRSRRLHRCGLSRNERRLKTARPLRAAVAVFSLVLTRTGLSPRQIQKGVKP